MDRTIQSTLSSEAYTNSRYNKELLKHGAFGDCTIVCKSRSWLGHRNILCQRCHFFQACFNGRFIESSTGVNEVHMDDDEPEAVEALLYYLYTLDYPHELRTPKQSPSTTLGRRKSNDSGIQIVERLRKPVWSFDLLVYSIADKYNVPELMRQARSSLLDGATTAAATTRDGVNANFLANLDDLVALLDDLYDPSASLTDNILDLRTQILATVARPVTHHVRDHRLSDLIEAYPEFAIELLGALSKDLRAQEIALPGTRTGENRGKTTRLAVHIPMNEDSDSECD